MVRAASFTACGGRYGEVVGDVSVDWIFSFIGGVDVVVAELELWLDFMFRLDESLRLTPVLHHCLHTAGGGGILLFGPRVIQAFSSKRAILGSAFMVVSASSAV